MMGTKYPSDLIPNSNPCTPPAKPHPPITHRITLPLIDIVIVHPQLPIQATESVVLQFELSFRSLFYCFLGFFQLNRNSNNVITYLCGQQSADVLQVGGNVCLASVLRSLVVLFHVCFESQETIFRFFILLFFHLFVIIFPFQSSFDSLEYYFFIVIFGN